MSFIDQIFNEVVTPYLEPRIKRQSIKAVKGYVTAVSVARKIAITAYGIAAVAAVAVAGLLLVVIALIGLLPIDPQAALFVMLAIGLLLTGVSVFFAYQGLSQRKWLEMSKSNEMMHAVLKPWPTAYSIPDPRVILKGQSEAQRSYDSNREAKTSRANRTPDVDAYDTIDTHAPMGSLTSMTTPEASIATESIDTTDALRRPRNP